MAPKQVANKINIFTKRNPCLNPLLQSRRLESGTHLTIKFKRLFSVATNLNQQQLKRNKLFHVELLRVSSKTRLKWFYFPLVLVTCSYGLFETLKKDSDKERILDKHGSSSRLNHNVTGNLEEKQERREISSQNRPWLALRKMQNLSLTQNRQVQVMSTLPLKAISRIWGRFNELEIPYYLRVPEVSEPDLHAYPNLASFFYRSLKPGSRPLDANPNSLISPADGRVLQLGLIDGGEVEQVKGVTYSLEALLGRKVSETPLKSHEESETASSEKSVTEQKFGQETVKHNEEFARVNDVPYTLVNLFSGSAKQPKIKAEDVSTTPKPTSEAEAYADLALGKSSCFSKISSKNRAQKTALYYIVIYLAPGDYHRFHSPCSWVVKARRHFAGELYSVSPYVQRMLPGLFTLNERVVLLGRWRWGFFSYIPVGATNVGSIKINFDRELKTNSLVTDTAADLAAKAAAERGDPYCGYSEATYEAASPTLRGYALSRGEEMGGFMLGSTIVLVFEAAKGERPTLDEGWMGESSKRRGGWHWAVEQGQKVKMGQALGWVDES